MCPLGLPLRHFWDMDSYSFLFMYCWEVFSPSFFTMSCKCFCTEVVKNNLILESISLSTAWWKVQICWCEIGRVMVWLMFSSGNSRRFSSLPWKNSSVAIQCLMERKHTTQSKQPFPRLLISFVVVPASHRLFHSRNKNGGLLLIKKMPTTEKGITSK